MASAKNAEKKTALASKNKGAAAKQVKSEAISKKAAKNNKLITKSELKEIIENIKTDIIIW